MQKLLAKRAFVTSIYIQNFQNLMAKDKLCVAEDLLENVGLVLANTSYKVQNIQSYYQLEYDPLRIEQYKGSG